MAQSETDKRALAVEGALVKLVMIMIQQEMLTPEGALLVLEGIPSSGKRSADAVGELITELRKLTN